MLGDNLQELSTHFDSRYLPEEFGGSCPPYNGSDWIKFMENETEKGSPDDTLIKDTPSITTPA